MTPNDKTDPVREQRFVVKVLRWIAVLPGALLTWLLIGYPLHLFIYFFIVTQGDPYPEWLERFLHPIVGTFSAVWVGAIIAPSKRRGTAFVLAATFIAMICASALIVGKGMTIGRIVVEPAWFKQICCVAAAVGAVIVTAWQSPEPPPASQSRPKPTVSNEISKFKFSCPKCDQHIEASSKHVGAHALCPTCRNPLVVPAPDVPQEAERPVSVDRALNSLTGNASASKPKVRKVNLLASILGYFRKEVRDWVLLGWAVVWIGWGTLQFFYAVKEWQYSKEFERMAATAEGLVTYADPGYKSRDDEQPPEIGYSFSVNGADYTGSASIYIPKGEFVQIRYLPSDPTNSIASGDKPKYETNIFLGFLFATIGAYCFMTGFNHRTANMLPRDTFYSVEKSPFICFPIIIACSVVAYAILCVRDGTIPYSPYETYSHRFYQTVRWIVCPTTAVLSVVAYRWKQTVQLWVLAGIAILFNPLVPIVLPDGLVPWVYLPAIGGMLMSAKLLQPASKTETAESTSLLASTPGSRRD